MRKREFLEQNKEGKEEVIGFISDFLFTACDFDISKQLTYMFTHGYCYYFAKMLQDTFQRGEIVVDKANAHVAWKDEDGKIYDITGLLKRGDFAPSFEKYLSQYKKKHS